MMKFSLEYKRFLISCLILFLFTVVLSQVFARDYSVGQGGNVGTKIEVPGQKLYLRPLDSENSDYIGFTIVMLNNEVKLLRADCQKNSAAELGFNCEVKTETGINPEAIAGLDRLNSSYHDTLNEILSLCRALYRSPSPGPTQLKAGMFESASSPMTRLRPELQSVLPDYSAAVGSCQWLMMPTTTYQSYADSTGKIVDLRVVIQSIQNNEKPID